MSILNFFEFLLNKLTAITKYRFFSQISLLLVLLMALALRLFRHWQEPMISRDAQLYLHQGTLWADGSFTGLAGSGAEWIPPLLSWSIGCGIRCGSSAYMAGIAINIIAGMLLVSALFLFVREFCGNSLWGMLGALFGAIVPEFIQLSIEIQREMLYLLFFTLTLWLVTQALRRQRLRYWGAAGFLFFPTVLSRYEVLELLVFIPLFLAYRFILDRKERKNSLKALVYFVGGIIAGGIFFSLIIGIPPNYYFEILPGRLKGI